MSIVKGLQSKIVKLSFSVIALTFSMISFTAASDSVNCSKETCSELAEKYLEQDDIGKASQTYIKGCELNNSTDCYNAATIFANGYLGEQDFTSAKPFYEKACTMQDADACSDLGDEYDSLEDLDRSRIYFTAACELDHAYGCQQLAWKLEHDVSPIDLKQATALNQKACDLGSGWACNNLGYDYMGYDDGVNPHAKRDYAKGIELMTLACDSYGIGSACTSLSYAYENGHGLKESLSESHRYAVKACEEVDDMDSGGCVRAGYGFGEGEGTKKDLDKSLYFYELACQAEDSAGCYGAAYYYQYEVKKRTKATRKKAKYFYALACELGDKDAC